VDFPAPIGLHDEIGRRFEDFGEIAQRPFVSRCAR
jgi:hypothetical protein